MIRSNPIVAAVSYGRLEDAVEDPATGEQAMNECSASADGIFRRFQSISYAATRPLDMFDFRDLDALVPHAIGPNIPSPQKKLIKASLLAVEQERIPLTGASICVAA